MRTIVSGRIRLNLFAGINHNVSPHSQFWLAQWLISPLTTLNLWFRLRRRCASHHSFSWLLPSRERNCLRVSGFGTCVVVWHIPLLRSLRQGRGKLTFALLNTFYKAKGHLLFTKRPGLFSDIILAGTPATVAFSGTSFTTTAPAPILALFPI